MLLEKGINLIFLKNIIKLKKVEKLYTLSNNKVLYKLNFYKNLIILPFYNYFKNKKYLIGLHRKYFIANIHKSLKKYINYF